MIKLMDSLSASSSHFSDCLPNLIAAQKSGQPVGIYSLCTSNPYVLEAAMRLARRVGETLLIESTSNQVNQYGGYMGLTPLQFRQYLNRTAERFQLLPGQILLGGDHLGPNVWRFEPTETALAKAAQMTADTVRAGYTKIHLDASMPLGDDHCDALDTETIAWRAALLCQAAENAWRELPENAPPPCYVIGTEVPPPGGAQQETSELEVSSVESVRETLEANRRAFQELGVEAAWERVIAVVVQPGVEYGNLSIHPYQREKAADLSAFIETIPGLVYEAHSTDYQTPQALREMVCDHFAILKVGPALTFAFREAIFALEMIEQELLPPGQCSQLRAMVEGEMLASPQDWERYYHGSPGEQHLSRLYSLSDRIRYYWNRPRAKAALDLLLKNLRAQIIPLPLVSQFLPDQYQKIRQGSLGSDPREWIDDKIHSVINEYRYACGES